ncbi:MAG: hypothetical protein K1X79_05225 [Oligoflexia bacterium]|nr:hypothetical protein [Oligoflexia bacterium]
MTRLNCRATYLQLFSKSSSWICLKALPVIVAHQLIASSIAMATPHLRPGECLVTATFVERVPKGVSPTSGTVEINEDSGEAEYSVTLPDGSVVTGSFQATPKHDPSYNGSERYFSVKYSSFLVNAEADLGYAWDHAGAWGVGLKGTYDLCGPTSDEPFVIYGEGKGDPNASKGASGSGVFTRVKNDREIHQHFDVTAKRKCLDTIPPNLGGDEAEDEFAVGVGDYECTRNHPLGRLR